MRRFARIAFAAAFSSLLAVQARAGHHSWDMVEAFSNADRTIQFIEVFCVPAGENLGTWSIISDSGGTFTFPSNQPGTSANHSVLIGTAGYALAAIDDGAPAPDFALPDAFFEPASDTLRYAGSADVWAVSGVPTDGINSLNRTGGVMVNSPRNYAGATGSIDVSTPPPGPGVPTIGTLGIVVLVGLMLLAASGIFRRREDGALA